MRHEAHRRPSPRSSSASSAFPALFATGDPAARRMHRRRASSHRARHDPHARVRRRLHRTSARLVGVRRLPVHRLHLGRLRRLPAGLASTARGPRRQGRRDDREPSSTPTTATSPPSRSSGTSATSPDPTSPTGTPCPRRAPATGSRHASTSTAGSPSTNGNSRCCATTSDRWVRSGRGDRSARRRLRVPRARRPVRRRTRRQPAPRLPGLGLGYPGRHAALRHPRRPGHGRPVLAAQLVGPRLRYHRCGLLDLRDRRHHRGRHRSTLDLLPRQRPPRHSRRHRSRQDSRSSSPATPADRAARTSISRSAPPTASCAAPSLCCDLCATQRRVRNHLDFRVAVARTEAFGGSGRLNRSRLNALQEAGR